MLRYLKDPRRVTNILTHEFSSPNAEEALSLLSITGTPTKVLVEQAAASLFDLGAVSIIIRSGALGAYVQASKVTPGRWIPAFFTQEDAHRVVDVTGAGNAFLGGLVAGLHSTEGDLFEGTYAC